MSTPAVFEDLLGEPDARDDVPERPPVAERDAVERVQHLLLWMRKQGFSASVVQVGDLTMHGVTDHVPRRLGAGSSAGATDEVVDVPDYLREASPALAEMLRKGG